MIIINDTKVSAVKIDGKLFRVCVNCGKVLGNKSFFLTTKSKFFNVVLYHCSDCMGEFLGYVKETKKEAEELQAAKNKRTG